MTLKPGSTIGPYRVTSLVGRGGMASVYRGFHDALKRDVAIKVLPDFFAEDREFRDRFAREGEAIARLRHPNIVTVFDVGESAGTPYMVTEYLDGQPLSNLLGTPMLRDEALQLLGPIAAALDYAHTAGVVHRDVKPSNIIVTASGSPVLTDFGLARIMGSIPRLTRTGTPLGTAEYMSPEQASGETGDASTDRYALAVIAYEMLTGRVPFEGEAPLGVLLGHISRMPPAPATLNPSIDTRTSEVLLKGLAKSPEDRFASATEFVERLAAASSRHAPEALPPPPPAPADHPHPRPHERSPRIAALDVALQSKLTLAAVELAALAGVYLLVLEPIGGYGEVAWSVLGGALIAALGAFGFSYRRERGARLAALDLQRAQWQRQSEQDRDQKLRDDLHSGFAAMGARDALGVLTALHTEYESLMTALARHADTQLLSVSLVPALAAEAYRRGLNCLVDALELMSAAPASVTDRLHQEVDELQREILELKSTAGSDDRLRIREATLASHRERLRKHAETRIKAEQMLFEAKRCEASLDQARVDLAAVRVGATDSGIDAVIQALQRTISQAREVQDELNRLGY